MLLYADMEANAGLVAGSHNRNELVVIRPENEGVSLSVTTLLSLCFSLWPHPESQPVCCCMGLVMELRPPDLHRAAAFRAFQRHPKAGKRDLVKWVNAERVLCFFCGKEEEGFGQMGFWYREMACYGRLGENARFD